MSDFAPRYTGRERIRIALILFAVVVVFYFLLKYWLGPWLNDYIATANCRIYNGFTGVHVVTYGMFVGMPLTMGLFFLLLFGPYYIRVWKSRQDPPPGAKVLGKTRIRRGRSSLLRPAALGLVTIFFIAVATWGESQAEKLTRSIKPCDVDHEL